jgi:protein arginine kinase
LQREDLCHREPEFAELILGLRGGIERVYPLVSESYVAVLLTSSGTGAVEAMLSTFAPRDAATLIASNGVYGERMATMLELQGKPYAQVSGPWTEPINLDQVVAALDAHPEVARMAVVHHETTTGRLNRLDDQLEGRLEFAFNEQFGYLTACPTNAGTGIRVSVMMHLPALKITGEIERVFRAARDMHLAVRGLYGEGTEATGDFYQISNQSTLGKTEEEIVEDFQSTVVPKITEYELRARDVLRREKPALVEDKVWRAIGMLKYARTINTQETLTLLSYIRLGLNMGLINDMDIDTINDLFLCSQPAHLQIISSKRMDSDLRSKLRAEFIRHRLCDHRNN